MEIEPTEVFHIKNHQISWKRTVLIKNIISPSHKNSNISYQCVYIKKNTPISEVKRDPWSWKNYSPSTGTEALLLDEALASVAFPNEVSQSGHILVDLGIP